MIELDEVTDIEVLKDRALDDREAQFQLGMRFTLGRGCDVDDDEAFDWLKAAAKNNHPYAQFRLGMAYMMGVGVDRDYFEAAVWFSASAAQGVDAAVAGLQLARFQERQIRQKATERHCCSSCGCC